MIASYRELLVWQRAMQMVYETYRVVKLLPKEEQYGLSEQMRRAAVSIPSNIAEGQARNSTKEFIKFLSIAKGSNAELQTQCEICLGLGYFQQNDAQKILGYTEEVGKMLNALIQKLTTSH